MARLTLRILGGFSARVGAAPLNVATRKAEALLAYLALPPGRAHARDKLATLLWTASGEFQARQSLRQTLVALRKTLPRRRSPILRAERGTLALDPAAVDVDADRFERLAASRSVKAIEQALALYQGDLLEGFRVTEEPFEDWLRAERARLRERALDALTRLLAHQTRAGETARAVHTAARLLALDPVRESVHRTLMRLHARQGRRSEALRQYQVCVGVLQRELGTQPEAETQRLYRDILEQTASRAASPASAGRPAPDLVPRLPEVAPPEIPLIGRDAEIARLRGALEVTASGQGRVAVIFGEAGIGKSRLLAELAGDVSKRGGRILLGRCHESEQILPFGPWVEALRPGGAGDVAVLERLNPVWRAELSRLFPEVAGREVPSPIGDHLRLFEAIVHLVERLAAAQPIVLMLEDLHWADEMSLRLLAFVARRIPRLPVLVVATAREEEPTSATVGRLVADEVGHEAHGLALTLSPLSRADIAALVGALAENETDVIAAARRASMIWDISEGNPFMAVEAIRALQQGAMPDGSTALALPARIRDVVARRLERLSANAGELAAVAAVIGREFEFALVQRAAGVTERDAALGIEELVRRKLLRHVGDRFEFTHDQIREVAQCRLLPPRRTLVHREVARALETLYADDLDRHCAALATHYSAGEVWTKAVICLRRAGAQSARRSAYRDAVAWFEQAVDVIDRLPESPSTLEQAFEIRVELRPALTVLGETRRALERLREAERLATRLNDDHGQGLVSALMTNVHAQLGELDAALASGGRAHEIATRLDDLRLRILTTTYLAQARYYRGDYEQAIALAADALAALPADWVFEGFGLPAPASVNARFWLVMSLAQLGRFTDAATYAAEARRLAEATCHAYTVGAAHSAAGILHLHAGRWAEARTDLEAAIAAYRSSNVVIMVPTLAASSAWMLAELGESGEALNRLRDAEALLEREATRGIVAHHGWAYHALGRTCLRLGRLGEARRQADRAIEACRDHHGFAAHAWHLRGEIATHADPIDAESGATSYRAALALAHVRGMRPLVARCHLGLATLYARLDKDPPAREHLTAAATMFREMDVEFTVPAHVGRINGPSTSATGHG